MLNWVFTGNGKRSWMGQGMYNRVKRGGFRHGARHQKAQLKAFNKHPSRFCIDC